MNPRDVRACTLRELHRFLTDWQDQQEEDRGAEEWDD